MNTLVRGANLRPYPVITLRILLVLTGTALCLPGQGRADTLYLLSSRGNVVTLDPATALFASWRGRVQTPTRVITRASGVGVRPGTGLV